LKCSKNKQRFIDLLTEKLVSSGCKVLHAQNVANVLVVQTAASYAETLSTTLIWYYTILLIFLQYDAKLDACIVFMQTDTHENNRQVHDINRIKDKLGTEEAENLLVCHAMSGCDATTRLHGVGKQAVVSLSLKDGIFKDACKIFITQRFNNQEITEAGEKILFWLYKGKVMRMS